MTGPAALFARREVRLIAKGLPLVAVIASEPVMERRS
jgi:hypothetical protein